jgi:STE24 endopeptidase
MSEMTAIRTSTVSLVMKQKCASVAGPVLLVIAAAESGVRLLTPREPLLNPLPVQLSSHFTAEEIERGTRYARPQRAIALARVGVDLVALAAATRHAPRLLRHFRRGGALGGAAAGAGLATALSALPLPLSALARRRAIKVGLITQSWRGWALDLAKGAAIEGGFAAAAGAAAVTITRRYPRGWWAPAAAGSTVVGAALTTLAPVMLDPVFNDFKPLPDGQTRADVLELARAAGVRVGEVYSVDASRRTTAANAYVTGLGPTKRVVLFDTLLDRYSRDEVRGVVGHELAHVRHRDVLRGVVYAALVAPAGALAVQRVSWALSPARSTPGALPALALATALVSAPVSLIGNRLSRAIERRADQFSLRLSDAPDAFVSFERAMALQNVADLQPPRWVTRLLATHPPTDERIGMALAYLNQGAQAPS